MAHPPRLNNARGTRHDAESTTKRYYSLPDDAGSDAISDPHKRRKPNDHTTSANPGAFDVPFSFNIDVELIALVAIQGDPAMRPVMARVCAKWRRAIVEVGPALAHTVKDRNLAPIDVRSDAGYDGHLAARGWIEILDWAYRDQGMDLTVHACTEAARHGRLDVLEWLERNSRGPTSSDSFGTQTCASAARAGHLNILRWLRCGALRQAEGDAAPDGANSITHPNEQASRCYPWLQGKRWWSWGSEICVEAARGGHLDVLAWAHDQGCSLVDHRVYNMAARAGRVDILEWLHERHCQGNDYLWAYAARSGSLETLQWVADHQSGRANTRRAEYVHLYSTLPGVCTQAARLGRIDMLEWALAHNCEWDLNTCPKAAYAGQLAALVWLRDRGCPWNSMTLSSALRGGHIDVFKWAVKNACPIGSGYVHRMLIKRGRTDLLRWMRARGCSPIDVVSLMAEDDRRPDIAEWAVTNNEPLTIDVCAKAAKEGNLVVLSWAHERGCPLDVLACAAAARAGRLDALKWLRANNCPWDEQVCTAAAENNHLDVLRWARANGCPWNRNAMDLAAKAGHLGVVQWLEANGLLPDAPTCYWACQAPTVQVIEWLIDRGCPWREDKCLRVSESNPVMREWLRAHVSRDALDDYNLYG